MIILLLLLISLPNSIVPEISARTAGFFGFLDSKISATLGSPPVISLVFEDALGILAMMSPAFTSLLQFHFMDVPDWSTSSLGTPSTISLTPDSTSTTTESRASMFTSPSAEVIDLVLLCPIGQHPRNRRMKKTRIALACTTDTSSFNVRDLGVAQCGCQPT